MTEKEMLDRAVEFDAGFFPIVNGRINDPKCADSEFYKVIISLRYRNENKYWAIVYNKSCLNKAGKWVYEPMPSSRTDEFISQTRWLSAVEAMEFYNKWVAAVHKWAEKETTPLNIPDDLELT